MKIIFNDLSEMGVQSVALIGDKLQIKTISAKAEELKAKFQDKLATKHMKVIEREQTIAEYNGYTELQCVLDFLAGILGVEMLKVEDTPEVQAEVQAAAVEVSRIQAQSLTDEEALTVQAIYPEWSGKSVVYAANYKVLREGVLYKCLQEHTSQEDWSPEAAPSLWAKVLNPDSSVITEWQQPESTNGYAIGDKVTHNGSTWESQVDNNVWEPGAVGTEALWVKVQ